MKDHLKDFYRTEQINKDTIIVFTQGEYSDYMIVKIAIGLKDFTLTKEIVESLILEYLNSKKYEYAFECQHEFLQKLEDLKIIKILPIKDDEFIYTIKDWDKIRFSDIGM